MSLKDADKYTMLFLQRQCSVEGMCVYVVKLTTSIDDDIVIDDEGSNTTMELHEMNDLNGHILNKKKSRDWKKESSPGRLVRR